MIVIVLVAVCKLEMTGYTMSCLENDYIFYVYKIFINRFRHRINV